MRKILLSPLIIVILLVLSGIGAAGAAVLLGGGGGTEEVNLQKGLVGHWKLDGDAKDSSVKSNHGTVTGATLTTDRKSQANKAYSFDGNDYVDTGIGTNQTLQSKLFTIEMWIKASSTERDEYIFSNHNIVNFDEMRLRFSNNKLQAEYYDNSYGLGTAHATSITTVRDDNWHHVVTTVTNSTISVYVDGSLEDTGSLSSVSNLANLDKTILGTRFISGLPQSEGAENYFNGSIDDVRIYNRALSQAEITALYGSYDPGIVVSDLQKGLIGHWKMDGDAKDSAINSNHGSVTGATLTTDRKGQANKAYSFDGNDYVNAGSGTSLDITGNEITVGLWIKIDQNFNSSDGIIIQSDQTREWGFKGASGTNTIAPWINNNEAGGVALSLGSWHHVVLTYDNNLVSNQKKLYVDGTLGSQTTLSGVLSAIGSASVYIGYEPSAFSYYFDGSIDDVRVYNRALSQTEITALYGSYDPGITMSDLQKGLVGHWKLDGDAKDSAINSNHGSVTGATLTIDRKGQVNKAYSFDGVDDYVSIPTYTVDKNNGTIGVWFKSSANFTGNYAEQGHILGYDTKYLSFLGLAGSGTAPYHLWGETNLNTEYYCSVPDIVPAGVWNFVAVSFNNGNAKTYLNGVLIDSRTVTTNLYLKRIGVGLSGAGNTPFNGLIDDVRIYNRALSQTEITALYESY